MEHFRMKKRIRRPRKSMKLSKWAFLMVYAFIVLTVSSSFTLAKYITTGTIDDSARVATAGEYDILISQDNYQQVFKDIKINDETINKSIIIGADTANTGSERFIRVTNDTSETVMGYSIVLVLYGKLPLDIADFKVSSAGPNGIIAKKDENSELIDTYLSKYQNEYPAEEGYRYSVKVCSGGFIPANKKIRHDFSLSLKWTDGLSQYYSFYMGKPDDYLLEIEKSYIDIYIIIDQLDKDVGN